MIDFPQFEISSNFFLVRNVDSKALSALNKAGARLHSLSEDECRHLEKIACTDPHCAFLFLTNIPGADVDYCVAHLDEKWLEKYNKRIMQKVCE